MARPVPKDGRFEIGDLVRSKNTGTGTITNKVASEKARLVGKEAWVYKVKGGGFNPDELYSENSLVLADPVLIT